MSQWAVPLEWNTGIEYNTGVASTVSFINWNMLIYTLLELLATLGVFPGVL